MGESSLANALGLLLLHWSVQFSYVALYASICTYNLRFMLYIVYLLKFVLHRTRLHSTAMMKLYVATILLLINVTRRDVISASTDGAIVARQHHHQLTNHAHPAAGKRWAPTEIRMNEFVHKIRSRFNGQSAAGFARRAVQSGQSKSAVGKMLKNDVRAGNKSSRGVKLYRLRSRFSRISPTVKVIDGTSTA